MKRLSIVFAVALACQVGVARAQKPDAEAAKYPKTEPRATSLGDLKPTTEMWFYEQAMRQYQDPKAAVRRNAELRRAAPTAVGRHAVVRTLQRASAGQLRSDPHRILARLGLEQRLLSVSLERQLRAGDRHPQRVGPVPAVRADRRAGRRRRLNLPFEKRQTATPVLCERPKQPPGSGPTRRSCEECAARAL